MLAFVADVFAAYLTKSKNAAEQETTQGSTVIFLPPGFADDSSFGSSECLYTQGLCASKLTTAPSQVERKNAVLRQFRAAEEDGES